MRIILCADDFGRSSDRNRAIDCAIKEGLIQSAGLMIGSDYTTEALEYAFSGNYINKIHCHLNLTSGRKKGDHFVPVSDITRNRLLCRNAEFNDVHMDNPLYLCFMKDIYTEIEKQYLLFKELSQGAANYNHIDFHLYYNTRLPVSYAYNTLIKKYKINTARYYGEHHKRSITGRVRRAFSMLFSDKQAAVIKSCNADYFRTMRNSFSQNDTVEIYCHPDYINGILIDNSKSVFGHGILPLEQNLENIKEPGTEIISWADVQANG